MLAFHFGEIRLNSNGVVFFLLFCELFCIISFCFLIFVCLFFFLLSLAVTCVYLNSACANCWWPCQRRYLFANASPSFRELSDDSSIRGKQQQDIYIYILSVCEAGHRPSINSNREFYTTATILIDIFM